MPLFIVSGLTLLARIAYVAYAWTMRRRAAVLIGTTIAGVMAWNLVKSSKRGERLAAWPTWMPSRFSNHLNQLDGFEWRETENSPVRRMVGRELQKVYEHESLGLWCMVWRSSEESDTCWCVTPAGDGYLIAELVSEFISPVSSDRRRGGPYRVEDTKQLETMSDWPEQPEWVFLSLGLDAPLTGLEWMQDETKKALFLALMAYILLNSKSWKRAAVVLAAVYFVYRKKEARA